MYMAVSPVTDEHIVQKVLGTYRRRSFTRMQSTKPIQLCRNIMTGKDVNPTDIISELQSRTDSFTATERTTRGRFFYET